MSFRRLSVLFVIATSLGFLLISCSGSEPDLPDEGPMPELPKGGTWFNSGEITNEDLKGKVVLVDFWTYSCVNCLRAMPYVKAWYSKYKDDGFIVIGIHAPEFDFEHDTANVSAAIARLGIEHPVLLDNDMRMWKAFNNKFWPAHYFIDAEGEIRYHHYGEGEYEESERVIRQLLTAAKSDSDNRFARNVSDTATQVSGVGATAPPDFANVRSHETYLGFSRAKGRVNRETILRDSVQTYSDIDRLSLNDWALGGNWLISRQFAEARETGARISYRFHARDLNLVLRLPESGEPVKFRITLDGQPPGSDAGVDVDSLGNGVVTENRMYQLVRQEGPIRERTFVITFEGVGVRVYAFTFG